MQKEIGYGNYSVDSNGFVVNNKTGRILKPSTIKGGYKQVKPYYKGRIKCFLVHRLVAIAFHDNPKNLPEVGHLDNNPSNNCADNLKWVSCSENVKHSYNTGRVSLKATNHPKSIFDRTQVLTIRSLKGILKPNDVSDYFKCHSSTIRNIWLNKSYSSI